MNFNTVIKFQDSSTSVGMTYSIDQRLLKLVVLRTVILLVVAVLLPGCSKSDTDPTRHIAAIGEEKLTQADFNAYLKGKRIPVENESRVARAKKTFLERNALAQVIAKQGLVNEAELNAELREFRNQLISSRYFEAFLKKAVSDDKVEKYYKDNKSEFEQKELKLAQILLRIRPNMTEAEATNVFKRAVGMHKKAKSGANFSTLAKKHSDDYGTKRKGGAMGWVKAGQVDPQVYDEAAKLEKNEISQPIRTSLGYHIVKLLDKPKVNQQSFDIAKGQIRYKLRNEAKQKEMQRLLGELKISELK